MCSLLGPDTTLHLGVSYEPAVTMQNDLLVKRVPERVVAPLSYSLKDLPCLLEAAPEPFLSGPAGDVYLGVTTPLVKMLHLL